MSRRTARLLAAGVLLLVGCGSGPEAPHGSPVLVAVYWIAAGTRTLVYSNDADTSVATTVPAAGAEVDFVFDRRLDGARIEMPNPPITVTWPPGPAIPVPTAPPFADVFYNSVAAFGGQSAYAFLRPRVRGFPSTTAVTFHLDKTGLTSAYNEPMTGPSEITVMTDALALVPRGSTATDALPTFPPSYMFPVGFTNRLAAPSALLPFARARAGGVELPVTLAADALDPTLIYVSPATCLGGWPAGATVDVSFARGLPDAFAVPTAGDLIAGSFMVAGTTDAAVGGDCGNAVDGGVAPDGDAPDGGVAPDGATD